MGLDQTIDRHIKSSNENLGEYRKFYWLHEKVKDYCEDNSVLFGNLEESELSTEFLNKLICEVYDEMEIQTEFNKIRFENLFKTLSCIIVEANTVGNYTYTYWNWY